MLEIVVVCEAKADHDTGTQLADRVVLRECAWLDDDLERLNDLRRWSGGPDTTTAFLKWTRVGDHARARNIRVHGHFDNKPAAPEYPMAVKALRVVHAAGTPSAVILLRDTDKDENRREGEHDLNVLAERGNPSGLADYLEECRSRLAPLFGTSR